MIFRILVIVLSVVIVTGEPQSRLVITAQGPVRGYKQPGDDVYVFHEIPYATAPTGPHKFKAPLPPPTWSEPFEAVQNSIICPQVPQERHTQGKEIKVQEDCLITNVYVPDTEAKNLPVLIYVHGGAFQYGFGSVKTPINLVKTKKIIAVNFNYRLGLHGFLCLGTEDVPGNAGLKDQVALLRWVQKNIASFGGNPNDVTIAGWSAGASSIDLLVLSPITRGLFHKVIPESSAGISAITLQIDPLENAKFVANQFSFDHGNDINALEAFYKNMSYSNLINVDVLSTPNAATLISPCIERDVGDEIFLGENALDILKRGDFPKLPTLYGCTDREGKYRIDNFETWKDMMNENFSIFLPQDLEFTNDEQKEEVAQEVKQFYFGNQSISEENILSYVDYFTDTMFSYGIARAIKMQAEAGNDKIYLYYYSFVDDDEDYIPHTNTRGARHCAQNYAVLDRSPDEKNISEENKKMKNIIRDLWLNFITTGEPVTKDSPYPEWPPTDENRSPYMSLNITPELHTSFLHQRVILWDNIYDKYYKPPVPPH
ncbi:venom carboxylesterase-6-like [Vanessa atalanta]|uniref:venom carboxylesterase-6-like n=1 Tax=Vanessa atalanta TaxID=42275 RepID=UPI001FCDDA2F|nr:venom carboxylesterase-6-like [Vanessa atalanta]